jgi:hypothetical protein
MAKLLYMPIMSLDGYVADEAGSYDWAMPDDEVFGFVNDFERPVGTYLYGRRLYQEMTGWETMDADPGLSPLMLDFARIWQAADKVVYSRSLEAVSTARTRLERDFDPGSVRQMKARADRDMTVGGPVLARRGDPGRPGRRDPPDHLPGAGGGRQEGAARRRPPAARPAGRAPVRQRGRPPSLPRRELSAVRPAAARRRCWRRLTPAVRYLFFDRPLTAPHVGTQIAPWSPISLSRRWSPTGSIPVNRYDVTSLRLGP